MATTPVVRPGSGAASSNTGSVTVSAPTGVASGDVVLLLVADYNGASAPTCPGFTSTYVSGVGLPYSTVLAKVAGPSEPGSYEIAVTGASRYVTVAALAVSGVDGFPTVVDAIVQPDGTLITAPAGQALVDNALLVCWWAGGYPAVRTLGAAPTGMSSVAYFPGTQIRQETVRVATAPVNAGNTGDQVVYANANVNGRGVSLVLNPSTIPNVTGGNPVTVTHTSTGGGDVGFSGGSVATAAHTPTGSGTAAATGGSAATVNHVGAGTGYPAIGGGAATTVRHVATAAAAVGVFTVRVGGTEYPATFAGVWNGTATVPATTQAKP